MLVAGNSWTDVPAIIIQIILKGSAQVELGRAEVDGGGIDGLFFIGFVGMSYDSAEGRALIRNSHEDGHLVESFIDEALRAVDGVDPHAQLLSFVFPFELDALGQLQVLAGGWKLRQFSTHAFLKLRAEAIAQILLGHHGHEVAAEG